MPVVSPAEIRTRRGRANHRAGLAAEDAAAALYARRGASVLARRLRLGGGEIDLVVLDRDVLVFVEVKRRKRLVPDSPVSERQWSRLERAATAYMVEHQRTTGAARRARFDVVLVDAEARPTVIENARVPSSSDEGQAG
ncbi:MAG: YraN family protein [Paracoccaceae bacterium]